MILFAQLTEPQTKHILAHMLCEYVKSASVLVDGSICPVQQTMGIA